MLTQEELKQILDYNPETGIWIWKVVKSRRVKIGEKAGTIHPSGYRHIIINGKNYSSSRLAFFYMTGRWPNPEIDHKNRIRNDDRWENLREATSNINNFNKKKIGNQNLPKGVSKHQNKFQAQVQINGKRYYLGIYDTPEEASRTYEKFNLENRKF